MWWLVTIPTFESDPSDNTIQLTTKQPVTTRRPTSLSRVNSQRCCRRTLRGKRKEPGAGAVMRPHHAMGFIPALTVSGPPVGGWLEYRVRFCRWSGSESRVAAPAVSLMADIVVS